MASQQREFLSRAEDVADEVICLLVYTFQHIIIRELKVLDAFSKDFVMGHVLKDGSRLVTKLDLIN